MSGGAFSSRLCSAGTGLIVGALRKPATHGISARAALEIAESGINGYLARMGRDKRVAALIPGRRW